MKLFAKVMVLLSFGWLAMSAGAAGQSQTCPKWVCGANSPVVAGAQAPFPSWGQNLNSPLVAGARAGIIVPGWGHNLNSPLVAGARIDGATFVPSWGNNLNSPLVASGIAVGTPFHELAIEGAAPTLPLPVGTTIDVHDASGARHAMRVAAHGATRFWAGADQPVVTHVLVWGDGAAERPVCTAGANEAILFSGDRYDSRRLAVTATGAAAAGWLNVACAGTAPAKLYLMRHTEASQGVPTTRAERQAMLKMLAADVYGDGHAFTIAGQPLRWADAKQITRFTAPAGAVEAVWNEKGAVCLNVPRIAALEDAIAAHGQRPPRCDDLDALPPGHVVSAHPR